MVESTTEPQTVENVRIRVFDATTVSDPVDARTATPKQEYQVSNITRDAYHKAVVDSLTGSSTDIEVDSLALGDSSAVTTSLNETQPLGNEIIRVGVTDSFADGQTFSASAFLDSTQGTGLTFQEAALVAETSSGDLPINRFLIEDPGSLLAPKSSDETVTIDIDLRQEDSG